VADVAIVAELPEQPEGVPFPTDEWPTADLPAGVDRAVLDAAASTAFRDGTDDPAHVRSLIVVQGGSIVHEAYHPGYDADSVNESYSVAKSMASAGIGLLVGDGLVSLEGPAPVADWSDPADPRHEITVEDLLNMASGLEWLEVYTPDSPAGQMFAAPDASDSVAARPLVAEPGTQFNYSTGTSAILAQIITDAAWAAEEGAPVDPALEPDPQAGIDFMTERLFDPIGITTVELMTDPEGTWMGGLGADMTTRDFARFGLLFMRDGVWDGERILPEGWVQYSFTPSAADAGYGAQWWLDAADGRFSARGLFGQNVVLVPELDLIVVTNSSQGGPVEPLIESVIAEFRSAG
jgi:CubicO group peptidase (beta-lactamase class C family)